MTTNLCRDAEDSRNERWTGPSHDAAGESRYSEKIVKQRPLNLFLPNNWRYLRGDIYYADMEPHIGSEQGGKRPVVVLQNNIGNRHSPTLIVATVTTRTEKKKNQPTHVLVDSNPAFEEPSMILLEQIFTIDKSRIERFMGYASKAEMLRIDMALLVSLALNVLSGNRSE